MSSNPLYGLRKVGTFVQLTELPGRPVRQPVFAGCTRRLCDRRLWLVTKSALEVYIVHDDALYKFTTFTFTTTNTTTIQLLLSIGICCSTKQDDVFVVYISNDDVSVLESKFKTEFLTVLAKHYKALTKRDLSIEFRDM